MINNILSNKQLLLYVLISYNEYNPLVPRVQKIKICNFTLNRLLVVEPVNKMVHLGARYSEGQGLMGQPISKSTRNLSQSIFVGVK